MIGYKYGFTAGIAQIAKPVAFTHCFIYRYALAVKTLPEELKQALDNVVRIINYIKTRTTNTRLFSLLSDDMDSKSKSSPPQRSVGNLVDGCKRDLLS